MPRLGRIALLLLLGLCGAYLAVVVFAFSIQRRLLFPAPRAGRVPASPGELLRIEERRSASLRATEERRSASLRATDDAGGPEVVAFYLPPPAEAPVVVYFHGNGEELADVAPIVHALARGGVGALAVEYPGYGLSGGAPSEPALYRAAETALRHLHGALGVPVARTVLLGQSIGTGVATEMARRGLGGRLVLLSPYTSIPALAARLLPFLPVRWLVRDRLDTAQKAPAIAIPTLLVHGTDDELIPADMSQELARRFPAATLHLLPGAHHNDLWNRPPSGPGQPDLLSLVLAFARPR